MSKGREDEEYYTLLNKTENKNIIIVDLLLEIRRLKDLLIQNGIDWRKTNKKMQ